MSKPKLAAIVVGSIRPDRFAEHAARWIEEIARQRGDVEVELVDLKDYPVRTSPSWLRPPTPRRRRRGRAARWQQKMAAFDAYIFTAAEYNRGPTAVLGNALDYAYNEWRNKPVAFVGYGGVGAARAVEQLLIHAIELQMAPIRTAVHILFPAYLAVVKEGKKLADFDYLNQSAADMLNQLAWWTDAAGRAREYAGENAGLAVARLIKPSPRPWGERVRARRSRVSG